MAIKKRTRNLKRRAKADFPIVTGKIVEAVELRPSDTGYSIGIMFADRTFLSFDVEPQMSFTIEPELSDWKTGNYKPLKRWPPVSSE
jgi:hypothetical protein